MAFSFCLRAACIVSVLGVPAAADNPADAPWPQWRGPGDSLVAEPGDYPTDLDADALAWKARLPGDGASTPVVWGDRLIVTCGVDGENTVVALDTEGEPVWQTAVGKVRDGRHRQGTGANPSPVVVGDVVCVYFKSGDLAALDTKGAVVWRHNLQERFGKDKLLWDLGTSPVAVGGNVVVAVMHTGESYLVAFDAETGEQAWLEPRNFKTGKESSDAYTTPSLVAAPGGGQRLIVWGADHLTAHDPATGETLWTVGGFNPKRRGMWRTIASAAVGGGVAVVPAGRGEHLFAVDLDQPDGGTSDKHRWARHDTGADVPTPIIRGDTAYLLTDRGGLHAIDLQSGKDRWTHQLPKARHNFYASPVLAGDLLFAAREDGTVFVGRVGSEGFELLSEQNLGETVLATPVVVDNRVYIRGAKHLFCFAS